MGRQHADSRRPIQLRILFDFARQRPGSGARHHRSPGARARPRPDRIRRKLPTSTRASWTKRASSRWASRRSTPSSRRLRRSRTARPGRSVRPRLGDRRAHPVCRQHRGRPAQLRPVCRAGLAVGLGMPDRDYYLRNDGKFPDTRKAYTTYIARTFALANQPDPEGAAARIHRSRPNSQSCSGTAPATAIGTRPTTRWASRRCRRTRRILTGTRISRRCPPAPRPKSATSSSASPIT